MPGISATPATLGVLINETQPRIAVSRCVCAIYATFRKTFVCRFCTQTVASFRRRLHFITDALTHNTHGRSSLQKRRAVVCSTAELRQTSCLLSA